jgi:hypothetical protein
MQDGAFVGPGAWLTASEQALTSWWSMLWICMDSQGLWEMSPVLVTVLARNVYPWDTSPRSHTDTARVW